MFLKHLDVLQFKNHEQVQLELSPGINCFFGPNGAGKTNLLDAVYYLSMCKSYLNPVDRQNIRFGQSFFMVQGDWMKGEEEYRIQCSVKQGAKKVVRRNKKEYERLSDHVGEFPVVIISPYDRDLISEGSEWRRKWMDGIICQTDKRYLHDLQQYTRILEQRNALLKSMYDRAVFDRDSLEVWNDQLVEYGTRIHQQRLAFINQFLPVFHRFYAIFGQTTEQAEIQYRSQLNDQTFPELLTEMERKDAFSQYTNAGPHKDDLLFVLNEVPIKKFGSQGQQKSFLIALRLAQHHWLGKALNVVPVLMLDDIFDKLDGGRIEQLMELVCSDAFGQVMITDTDGERIKELFQRKEAAVHLFELRSNEVSLIQ
jgi:DNA replication and repair protein RecF